MHIVHLELCFMQQHIKGIVVCLHQHLLYSDRFSKDILFSLLPLIRGGFLTVLSFSFFLK